MPGFILFVGAFHAIPACANITLGFCLRKAPLDPAGPRSAERIMKEQDFQKAIKEILRNLELFKNLKDEHLDRIAVFCRRRAFSKGAVIFYQGESSSNLLIVLSGKLKATIIDRDNGDEVVLSFFKEGEFLGEMNLFDGAGRSATVTAEEDSEIAVLEREKLMGLLMEQPRIAIGLITELAKRLRKADEMIESLAFLDVKERLLREFSKIAESEGAKGSNCLKVGKKTHQELAARIGASREAVSKCLKHLAAKDVVKDEEAFWRITLETGSK